MTKYQINYNRVVQDHRVPFDYTFVKKTQSPMEYFKYYKQGFNTSWAKYYHMHITTLWIGALIGLSAYVFWNRSSDVMVRDKVDKYPSLNFLRQKQRGNYAPWDLVLAKYSTDPLGNKDQPFKEY